MPKYRKIPVVVEAVKLKRSITIETAEGTVRGLPGDYLITEPSGEQYPIRSEEFEATYERVKSSKDLGDFLKRALGKLKNKSTAYFMKNQ
ncbi:hypothetical protein [Alkalihalobacterium sp. APHAB7]|uniref:hypothetical protein n=1 Tax=Alkalihalobacterium sp. APHAB7 TaxID=3402081 RepID=UPI003AAB1184